MNLPTQDEIDSVAIHFGIGLELAKSPFLDQDSLNLGFTGGAGGDLTDVRLADKDILKAALISFRRLWQQSEPTRFDAISGIFYRCAANDSVRTLLKSEHERFRQLQSEWLPLTPSHSLYQLM